MSKYRNNLPQLSDNLFLTDSGLETTLIFHEGWELPYFAAFDLLNNEEGYFALREYYVRHVALATRYNTGFILESATWRANPDWAVQMGHDAQSLDNLNRAAIDMLRDIRNEFETADTPMVISGCVGPRGDGYNPETMMAAVEAQSYHSQQIESFRKSDADMISAITMTYPEEAIGVTRASLSAGLPVAISFTVETDGRLPSGHTLREAIEMTDAATGNGPAYYMINCAHPTHFEDVLKEGGAWLERIRGLRTNASCKSHAELDEATELDAGNPRELGEQHLTLKRYLPNLTVVGGCCGTDHSHVEEICKALEPVNNDLLV